MRTLILALGFAAVAATPAYAQTGATGTAAPAATLATGTNPSTNASNAARSTAAANAAPVSSGQTSIATGNRVTGDNVTKDPNAGTPPSSFAPGGPFDNTPSGTTQAGTAAPGIVTMVPDNVSVIGTGGSTTRFVAPAPTDSQAAQSVTLSNTPLFDQAAREGRAKEERRRARGEEPRVYGIAPNTERDLTWQMPDDKVIRY